MDGYWIWCHSPHSSCAPYCDVGTAKCHSRIPGLCNILRIKDFIVIIRFGVLWGGGGELLAMMTIIIINGPL